MNLYRTLYLTGRQQIVQIRREVKAVARNRVFDSAAEIVIFHNIIKILYIITDVDGADDCGSNII